MERFPGREPDTFLFYYEGFTYHRDRRVNSRIYRCTEKNVTGCRGKVQVVGERPIIREDHMHRPKPRLRSELRFREEVLRRCCETFDPFNDIFRDVSLQNPVGALNVTYISMHNRMVLARRGARPPVPDSWNAFSRVLENYQPVQNFYRGCVRSAAGHTALVFANEEMIQQLNVGTEIFVDGKFRVQTDRPGECHLLVVYVRRMDVAFPVAVIFCEQRTAALYEAVFRFLVTLAPRLEIRLQFVVSDYDREIIRAIRAVFPEARLRGCWFFFCQALIKKWRITMPRNARKDIVWMLMSIPLLPRETQNEALGIITVDADNLADQNPSILRIMHYYRRHWVPLTDLISVGRAPVRTNNFCEYLTRMIWAHLGDRHANIWIVLNKLHALMINVRGDWLRQRRGERIRAARNRRQFNEDIQLARHQFDLDTGRIELEEFLRVAVSLRQRQAIEAADFLDAVTNDRNPVILPTPDDFPALAEIVPMRIDGRADVEAIEPRNIHAENAPEANVQNVDRDDEFRQDNFALPPIAPPPEFNDEVLVIGEQDGELDNVIIISSDDEDDDNARLGIERYREREDGPLQEPIIAAAPNLQPLDIEANVQVAVPEVEVAPDVPEPAMEIAAAVVPAMGEAHEREPAQAEAPLAARPAPGLGSSDEEEEVLQRNRCSICLRHRPRIMFMPCNHLVTCERCSEIHLRYRQTCPLCREPIERTIRAYFG